MLPYKAPQPEPEPEEATEPETPGEVILGIEAVEPATAQVEEAPAEPEAEEPAAPEEEAGGEA